MPSRIRSRVIAYRIKAAKAKHIAIESRKAAKRQAYELRGQQPKPGTWTHEDMDTRGIKGDVSKYWGK